MGLLRALNDLIYIAYFKHCRTHTRLFVMKSCALSYCTGSKEYTECTRGNLDWLCGPQIE